MFLYVRRKSNKEIINKVDVTSMNLRQIEQVITQVVRNLDHTRFYIDDTECFEKMKFNRRKLFLPSEN